MQIHELKYSQVHVFEFIRKHFCCTLCFHYTTPENVVDKEIRKTL